MAESTKSVRLLTQVSEGSVDSNFWRNSFFVRVWGFNQLSVDKSWAICKNIYVLEFEFFLEASSERGDVGFTWMVISSKRSIKNTGHATHINDSTLLFSLQKLWKDSSSHVWNLRNVNVDHISHPHFRHFLLEISSCDSSINDQYSNIKLRKFLTDRVIILPAVKLSKVSDHTLELYTLWALGLLLDLIELLLNLLLVPPNNADTEPLLCQLLAVSKPDSVRPTRYNCPGVTNLFLAVTLVQILPVPPAVVLAAELHQPD